MRGQDNVLDTAPPTVGLRPRGRIDDPEAGPSLSGRLLLAVFLFGVVGCSVGSGAGGAAGSDALGGRAGGTGGAGLGQTGSGGAVNAGSGGMANATGGATGSGGAPGTAGSGSGGRLGTGGSGGTSGQTGGAGGSGSGAWGGGGDGGGAMGTGGRGNGGAGAMGTGGRGSGGAGAMGTGGVGGAGGVGTLTSFKLTVIGSSTAAGEGASSSAKGWVGLLSKSLTDAGGSPVKTSNLAVGGYTTTELLPGSNASGGIDDAIRGRPNLILVSLAGSNDLSAGTSQSTFLSRLVAVREAARAAGIPVFFVSTAPKDLSDSERRDLRDWAAAMADSFAMCWVPESGSPYAPCFVDIFAALANSSLGVASAYSAGDGIHLNDAGHAKIFGAADAIVKPYVCSRVMCK